jgi:hypothetical protein
MELKYFGLILDKRQKRIENNSIAAMNALSQLEDCEESLRQLFKITKLARSHESHLPAQNEALANLRALKNRLSRACM